MSRGSCFNPLHCGAVVASYYRSNRSLEAVRFQSPSLRGSGRFSTPSRGLRHNSELVSIPFIAGQWSLRGQGAEGWSRSLFQSPSLRGSGRFRNRSDHGRRHERDVSIPFIAGQWSLLLRTTPFPVCAVLLPNLRPACDHLLWACLHRWPKPAIIP